MSAKDKVLPGTPAIVTERPSEIHFMDDQKGIERHFVRSGEGYQEVTTPPIKPLYAAPARKYLAADQSSFIALVKRLADDKSIAMVSDGIVTCFLDEATRAETIAWSLIVSQEAVAFGVKEPRLYSQKELFTLLRVFSDKVENGPMLAAMVEAFKYSGELKIDSNIDRDNHVFSFALKSGGDQKGKLPKIIHATIPIIKGSETTVLIDIDLDYDIIKNENGIKFSLSVPGAAQIMEKAIDDEIAALEDELKGYMILKGKSL